MKKIFKILGLLLVLFISVLLFNALTFKSKQLTSTPVNDIELTDSAIEHLQQSIRIKTISNENINEFDSESFLEFHKFLATTYPLVDSLLKPEVINDYSLLYTWKGSDNNVAPIILMAHTDVVPIDKPTFNDWKAPPFSGDILEESIWGRGSMDDKGNLIALMESVEKLLHEGYKPNRTIYLAFGHDEEIGGKNGAGFLAKHLKDKGVHAEFVLDEGGFVLNGIIPGIDDPVALIATAEKGFLTLELTVTTNGGHSSMPTRENAIGTMATAIHNLENNQFEYKPIQASDELIEFIGPELPFLSKLVFANKWLFGGLILKGLNNHTTIAPTIINSGVKDNVLPTKAVAKINFRILPGETPEQVKEHVIKVINNEDIKVEIVVSNFPSKVSSSDTEAFKILSKTIVDVMPGTVVSPGLTPGGTDTKHYTEIADYSYRFSPMEYTLGGDGPHSVNEHITLKNYKNTLGFYYYFIKNINE